MPSFAGSAIKYPACTHNSLQLHCTFFVFFSKWWSKQCVSTASLGTLISTITRQVKTSRNTASKLLYAFVERLRDRQPAKVWVGGGNSAFFFLLHSLIHMLGINNFVFPAPFSSVHMHSGPPALEHVYSLCTFTLEHDQT